MPAALVDEDFVTPCLEVLAMGFSWALFFCHAVTTDLVSREVEGDDRAFGEQRHRASLRNKGELAAERTRGTNLYDKF